MKTILQQIWKFTKLGLILWGALSALYVVIVIFYNATNNPTPPPGGWKPLPGDENYVEPNNK